MFQHNAIGVLTILLLLWIKGIGQGQESNESLVAQVQTIRLEGLVMECKKYSLKVRSGETNYTVKVANGAPIALKMNKPWYDWKNDQVVVDKLPYPNDPKVKPKYRVGVKLPAKKLYVISRFKEMSQVKYEMSKPTKRINFYLVTPERQEPNYPSKKRLYLAGELSVDKTMDRQFLTVGDRKLPIKLGFQFATMNGFSIADIAPYESQVFLTGIPGAADNEIIATRILFQPVLAEYLATASR